MNTEQEFKAVLKQYIESTSVTDVLMLISEACQENSARLSNADDNLSAEAWKICAKRLKSFIDDLANHLTGF